MIVLKYLEWLVRINPVKITYLLLTLLCLYGTNKFEPYKETSRVFKQFEWRGESVYITETNNNIFIEKFDEPQEVKDGFVYYDHNPGEITSWVFFAIFLLAFIISTFMGLDDDDIGWELSRVKNETYFRLIKMDEEDGKFYYHLNRKLIKESDYHLSKYDFRDISRYYIENKHILPEYKGTKQERRDKLLNKILK
jgi:hypothetical protein